VPLYMAACSLVEGKRIVRDARSCASAGMALTRIGSKTTHVARAALRSLVFIANAPGNLREFMSLSSCIVESAQGQIARLRNYWSGKEAITPSRWPFRPNRRIKQRRLYGHSRVGAGKLKKASPDLELEAGFSLGPSKLLIFTDAADRPD
jgi:hypothetical protein